ncbi:23S rRNA (guanosine(2251)-2'-O)-methyltransferase RlmB [Denitrobaculum tricleocarpae]|nr:23S rRNA (guanosine(2251)-2'-O)-methyltransferase RlmB [Denitrobaculum tricleocarpae]
MTQSKHPKNRRKSTAKGMDRSHSRQRSNAGSPKRPKTEGNGPGPAARPGGSAKGPSGPAHRAHWLFGVHAVLAALANPKRRKERLLVSKEAGQRHGEALDKLLALPGAPPAHQANREDFMSALPDSAVHQGLALQCAPLTQPHLEDLLAAPLPETARRPVVLVLDQVTDPQNVGAILRSAAAFGAQAVVTTGRNAAAESGVLVKTASGAFDHTPYIAVTNLARALESLKTAGYWSLGLAGEGKRTLADAKSDGPVALVLGAEGSGLRRLTRETCDELVHLPTREPISALNVSNAAAVALYELLK